MIYARKLPLRKNRRIAPNAPYDIFRKRRIKKSCALRQIVFRRKKQSAERQRTRRAGRHIAFPQVLGIGNTERFVLHHRSNVDAVGIVEKVAEHIGGIGRLSVIARIGAAPDDGHLRRIDRNPVVRHNAEGRVRKRIDRLLFDRRNPRIFSAFPRTVQFLCKRMHFLGIYIACNKERSVVRYVVGFLNSADLIERRIPHDGGRARRIASPRIFRKKRLLNIVAVNRVRVGKPSFDFRKHDFFFALEFRFVQKR